MRRQTSEKRARRGCRSGDFASCSLRDARKRRIAAQASTLRKACGRRAKGTEMRATSQSAATSSGLEPTDADPNAQAKAHKQTAERTFRSQNERWRSARPGAKTSDGGDRSEQRRATIGERAKRLRDLSTGSLSRASDLIQYKTISINSQCLTLAIPKIFR